MQVAKDNELRPLVAQLASLTKDIQTLEETNQQARDRMDRLSQLAYGNKADRTCSSSTTTHNILSFSNFVTLTCNPRRGSAREGHDRSSYGGDRSFELSGRDYRRKGK